MPSNAVEVQGTLREDGTLVLDQKPNLPPGRVKVTVEPVPDYKQTEIWQFFQRLWAEQRAQSHIPRTREEIDADLEAACQEDEEPFQVDVEGNLSVPDRRGLGIEFNRRR